MTSLRNLSFLIALVAMVLSACSSSSSRLTIEGRLLSMNQASFYVYSPEGVIEGIDTIRVQGGRFAYDKEVQNEGIIVLVFPNYSVLPIFVQPGADITIKGNAANLKKIEVEGTASNEDFTEWRESIENMSPPEIKLQAQRYIEDHPESPVSRWLIRQYFITSTTPDIKGALPLLQQMLTATENNINVAKMMSQVRNLGIVKVGDPMPRFAAVDINKHRITSGKYSKGTTMICLWASWNGESVNMLRKLAYDQNHRDDGGQHYDNVVTICLDASVKECRRTLMLSGAESLTTICDTMMWDSPLLKQLGFNSIPDNVKLQNGKVVARRIPIE